MQRYRRAKMPVILAMLLALSCILLSGCGADVTADISAYETDTITVTGVQEEAVSVTPEQLAELDCEKRTITSGSGERQVTATAVGPLLSTFLEQYGLQIEDFQSVTFVASDQYVKTFDGDFFITHPDVILSLANGDEPLTEEEQPMRLIIDGATPDNWVKGVVEIRFE